MLESYPMVELKEHPTGNPVYITKVAERQRCYSESVTFQLNLSPESRQWWNQFSNKKSFNFPSYKLGVGLFSDLQGAISDKDQEKMESVLSQMDPLLGKGHDEKTDKEKWDSMSEQLPEDWGLVGKNRILAKELITSKAKGKVLEAMCGFNSYFGNSPQIEEVVALDFSEKALERYEYPRRTRILFDMERVCQGKRIEFFEDNSFQTIGVFFGMDYLTNPLAIYLEFKRILQETGEILIVGGTGAGYSDILKRYFRPDYHANLMKKTGLLTNIMHLPLKQGLEVGEYYLISGKKK